MRVVILGATGGTGKILVREALQRGHHVVAAARDPTRLEVTRAANLNAVKVDVLDPASLDAALLGADAVVFAVGSGDTKASTLRTEGVTQVLAAMKRQGVRRLVAMSGLGAGDSFATLPFFVRKVIVPLVLKGLLEDQSGLERAVMASDVDWVVVRPGELKEKPATGQAKVSLDPTQVKHSVSRADVAEFILRQLESDLYLRKTPAIG